MSQPRDDIEESLARHASRRQDLRRAYIFGGILLVAAVAISVLSTLLWVNSRDNVDKLAVSNDAGIAQFEYCKKAPKTDPRCQDPVSKPATEVVKGPQGVQGVQGIQGIVGPQGDPGTPCLPSNPACRGPRGPAGPTPACMLLPSKCQGPAGVVGPSGPAGSKGDKGDQGLQGTQGDKGDKGDTGDPGAKGDKGDQGDQGDQGDKGDTGESGYVLFVKDCTDAGGIITSVKVSGDDPATIEVEPMVTVRTCVIP